MRIGIFACLVFVASAGQQSLPATLDKMFASDLRREYTDLEDCLQKENQSLPSVLKILRVELSAKHHATAVIEGIGLCLAGVNNGQFWVYMETDCGWRRVFSAHGYKFERLRTRQNGLTDVAVWGHSSASESVRLVYRFAGDRYRPGSCEVVTFEDLDGKYKRPLRNRCEFHWKDD